MSDWLGETFEIRLGPPGHGGFCVGRHEGRVVFVRHGLPGELVRARVTEDTGGSFCRAEAVEILAASADRVPSTCPVSGPGGAGCCDFAHASPAAQRALKASVVTELLHRIAGIDREISVEPVSERTAEATGGWRTRVRLPVDAEGRAGTHRYRSDAVLPDLRCPQPVPGMLDGIAERVWTPGADLVVALDGDGLRHIVELAPAPPQRGRPDRSGSRRRGPAGRRGAATARRAAAHAPRAERVVEGSGRAVEYVAGRRWELAATAFWQAHRDAAQRYSDLIAGWAGLSAGESAWDLYSGAGVFAARLAEQVGPDGTILAVESARSAVTDGRAALRDLPWVDLRSERVERWLGGHGGPAPRAVVLDPPRAGAGKEVTAAVTAAGPERIVHVGCDPASFARDLGLYIRGGYQLADLRVFDAFPATHHMECLALLTR
ncbi:MAG TPA: TRAM domain-containing protein [Nocardia sp.]|nr:TRAM domain-containing protein [Nocardia sp.]HLS76638.1 TRAM domain-containing protein [Nocardia sp.]